MSLWPELRALAWLKRSALALESIARSQETLARSAALASAPRPRPAMTTFDELDVQAANSDWSKRRRIELEEAGIPIDEEPS